jgi:hypothetical protein
MFYVLNIFIIKEISLHYLVFWEKKLFPSCTLLLCILILLWFVVYSVVYTLYHNSPVVWCLYSTSGLWFVVYSVVYTLYHNSPAEYTTNHNPLVVYRHLTTGGMWYNVYTTEYTTNHNPLSVYRHLTTDELWYNIRMHSSSVHEGNSFFPRIQGNVKLFLWLWKYLKHKTLWNI